MGFETINLSGHKIPAKDRQRIKRTINRLIGAEIVEETTERVVVQCLLKVTAFPPDKILRRGCLLSSSLVSDAFSAFLRGDRQLAESILERDEEVDRLYFLLVRLLRALIVNPRLSEKLNVSLIGCLDYRLIASLVETIADQAVEIAMLTLKFPQGILPPRTAKQFEFLTQRIKDAYEEVVKTIFAPEEKALASATAKRIEAQQQLQLVETELNGIKPGPPVAAVTGFATVKRIFDGISDIIDLVTPKSRLEKGL
ncbi:MAG: PhoU domain-containing protein [Candidatus Bathyarchaeia archaeon]